MNHKYGYKWIRKTLVASGVALALATTSAEAALVLNVMGYPDPNFGTPEQSFRGWSTDSANFTMLYTNGSSVGGTNNVNMYWNGNAYSASSDYTGPGGASNATLSSATRFFGTGWAAHDVQFFVPGSYTFDTAQGGGNPESGMLNATVGAG